MADRPAQGHVPQRRGLDLSPVQVIASALATVAGALLASLLGVYGTIVGAAVVSGSATTGAAVFQHLFHRTGDGLRGSRPARAMRTAASASTSASPSTSAASTPSAPSAPAPSAPSAPPSTPAEARAAQRADARAAFTPAPVPARRPRGWRTYALTTGLVFLLAMGTLTVVELIAGKPVAAVVRNEPGRGTSIGGGSAGNSTPAPGDSRTPSPGTSTGTASQPGDPASPTASSLTATPGSTTPDPAASALPGPADSSGVVSPLPSVSLPAPAATEG
jgi:hypothetical protein